MSRFSRSLPCIQTSIEYVYCNWFCFGLLKVCYSLWLLSRHHNLVMEAQQKMRAKIRHRSQGRRVEYPPIARNEPVSAWFPTVVQQDMAASMHVEDVAGLFLPPSCEAKSYRSMYAYGNHIRVHRAEVHLTTYNSGVTATFNFHKLVMLVGRIRTT